MSEALVVGYALGVNIFIVFPSDNVLRAPRRVLGLQHYRMLPVLPAFAWARHCWRRGGMAWLKRECEGFAMTKVFGGEFHVYSMALTGIYRTFLEATRCLVFLRTTLGWSLEGQCCSCWYEQSFFILRSCWSEWQSRPATSLALRYCLLDYQTF